MMVDNFDDDMDEILTGESKEETEKEDLNPKKRGLGRGLSALFDDDEEELYPFPNNGALETSTTNAGRRTIGIDQLEPGPFQPRQYINHDTINELAESIAVHGVLQPLLVREKPDVPDMFQIIAGERRWHASQKAQLHEVPVIVKDLSDEAAMEIALIENLQREDLNALDEAEGYQRLMSEYGHTQEKLAAALGKSRSHIANITRLLTLPPSVQLFLRQDKISAGHARALITAEDPEAIAKTVINHGLSVRETEKLVAGEKEKPAKEKKKAPVKDTDTRALEADLSAALGMKVTIDAKGKSGTLKVAFKDLDQLDELMHRLSHRP